MKIKFGTDGIRGRVNQHPITESACKTLGLVLGSLCHMTGSQGPEQPFVLIGRDTRESGPLLERALSEGLKDAGVDVGLLGVLPTPAIARATVSSGASYGVVISASHNPYWDNGIKLFGADGFKLTDREEAEIEERFFSYTATSNPLPGKTDPIENAAATYRDAISHATEMGLQLKGMHLVVDCAHGATFNIAPALFSSLGAEVTTIGTTPDGKNINNGVGAAHPLELGGVVQGCGADLGIAYDGDGDRVVFVDERGVTVDGDALLYMITRRYLSLGNLPGNAICATVMSNIGLEVALQKHGISLVRTEVGDRHVVETMRRKGLVVGGEQSGHIVLLDYATTGDGILASLIILHEIKRTHKTLSELAAPMVAFPQVIENVPVTGKPPLETVTALQQAISETEAQVGASGRVLVRYSGTEPLLRIMIEGSSLSLVENSAKRLAEIAHKILGESS